MKHKLFTLLALAGSIVCGAFAFAACGETGDNGITNGGITNSSGGSGSGNGGGEHTHESANYEVDGEYHWKTCDDCGTEFSRKKHSLQNDVCTVCGYSEKFTKGLEYWLDEKAGTYTVTSIGTAMDTNIIIPAYYEGKAITSIDHGAFKDCSGLTSITIPDSVTSIGEKAFDDTAYYNDESNWENGVLYIGKHLIQVKESISGNYTIKQGTLTIAGFAFGDCRGLTSITIPNSVKSICIGAFKRCSGLTSITIPDGVMDIGGYALYGCSELKIINISHSVTYIGAEAFVYTAYYSNERNWENNVLYIGKHLIAAKDEIEGSYTIQKDTLTIAGLAFEDCNKLTSIIIPDSVKSIGEGAFYNCIGLTNITIPNGVSSIGAEVFSDCSGLTSITIPDSVTSIGDRAFSGCSKLTSITVANGNTVYNSQNNCLIQTESKELILGCENSIIPTDGSVTSIGDLAFVRCSKLTSVTIGNSVTSIGERAFDNCSELINTNIPSSVMSIGKDAFRGCSSLTSVVFEAEAEWEMTLSLAGFGETDAEPSKLIMTLPTDFLSDMETDAARAAAKFLNGDYFMGITSISWARIGE